MVQGAKRRPTSMLFWYRRGAFFGTLGYWLELDGGAAAI